MEARPGLAVVWIQKEVREGRKEGGSGPRDYSDSGQEAK